MNLSNYLTGILALGMLQACSLVRSPEKTLGRVQQRFVDASKDAVKEAKGGIPVSDLEPMTDRPISVTVGDLVAVLRTEGGMWIEPIFQIEKIVAEQQGITELEKRLLVQSWRSGMSQTTKFSGQTEVTRGELGKVAKLEGRDALKNVREGIDDAKPGMCFLMKGEMEEIRASSLEEVYARIGKGRFGRAVPEGMDDLKRRLQEQLKLVEARLFAGGEIYSIGKTMWVDVVTGKIIAKEGKEDELSAGRDQAEAARAFGRVMIPAGGRSEVRVEAAKGISVFEMPERTCWSLTGYRVTRPTGGGLSVDAKDRLER